MKGIAFGLKRAIVGSTVCQKIMSRLTAGFSRVAERSEAMSAATSVRPPFLLNIILLLCNSNPCLKGSGHFPRVLSYATQLVVIVCI